MQWDGVVRGPELPSVRPDGKEWMSLTRDYYYAFRISPQAVKLGTDLDWYSVLDTCLLKDNFYRRPGGVLAAEIRARENAFGITPLARHALKWDAPSNDDLGAGTHRDVNKVGAQRMGDIHKILGV